MWRLGRYEEGWKEWWITRDCYERKLREGLQDEEDSEDALYFADILREIFLEYSESERYYKHVIDYRHDNTGAWTGLAILYQQWADSEDAPPEIRARSSYMIHRARELLDIQLTTGDQLQTLTSLADLQIETRDWMGLKNPSPVQLRFPADLD